MWFKAVALGLVLLVTGLAAYASIPAVHTTPVINSNNVWSQNGFPIQGGSIVERPKNVTVFAGMNNEMRVNLTVLTPERSISTLHFEMLSMNKSHECLPSSGPSTVLIDQLVSNQSISVPLNSTGTYCFVFDNQNFQSSKTVDISAQVWGNSEQVFVTRDGDANTFGLGLGALGLVVAIYGYARKTVIPWE